MTRYPVNAAHVRVIRFRHPCPTHTSPNVSEVTRSSDRVEAWEFASDLISALPGLEELVWETGFGVGDSMWKVRHAAAIAYSSRSRHCEI